MVRKGRCDLQEGLFNGEEASLQFARGLLNGEEGVPAGRRGSGEAGRDRATTRALKGRVPRRRPARQRRARCRLKRRPASRRPATRPASHRPARARLSSPILADAPGGNRRPPGSWPGGRLLADGRAHQNSGISDLGSDSAASSVAATPPSPLGPRCSGVGRSLHHP